MVVIALSVNSAFNAFMCMSYSAASTAASVALGIEPHSIAHYYTMYLFMVLACMTPVMWHSERHEQSALLLSIGATAAAAWIRWWSLHTKTYTSELCLLSQALIGYGACAVSTLPGKISHQRFKPSRWAMTTSLMLMANYAGWLFGSVVPTYVVVEGSAESLTDFFFTQCLFSLIPVLGYVLLYVPLPEAVARAAEEELSRTSATAGFEAVIREMHLQPQFTLQLCLTGLLGACGFVVPSAIFFILADVGFSHKIGGFANIAFIGTGVLGGVLLGHFTTHERSYPFILKFCHTLFAASCISCCIVAYTDVLHRVMAEYVIVFLMATSGFASLGFTGIAFEDLARFPKIKPDYVLWIGYVIMLAISVVLNEFCSNASGFVTLTVLSVITCSMCHFFYEQVGVEDKD